MKRPKKEEKKKGNKAVSVEIFLMTEKKSVIFILAFSEGKNDFF